MYSPSTIAAASVCAAFTGLPTEHLEHIWTKAKLVSFLHELTNVEPVRKGNRTFFSNIKTTHRNFQTVSERHMYDCECGTDFFDAMIKRKGTFK